MLHTALVLLASTTPRSADECVQLGFDRETLVCGSCDALALRLGASDALVHECAACCTPEKTSRAHAAAVLDICK